MNTNDLAVQSFLFIKEFNSFLAKLGQTITAESVKVGEDVLKHAFNHGIEIPAWLADQQLTWVESFEDTPPDEHIGSGVVRRLAFCMRMRICGNPFGERICVNVTQCYTCRLDGDCTALIPVITVS